MWLSKTPFHWNPTCPTRPIPSRFSTNKTESHATKQLGSTRYNGMITLKTKPRGNMKTSCDPTTPSSSRQGNYLTLLIFLATIAILGQDFLLRREGCNTPCYGSPNLSLITVISGLVMHDVTGLFNSESSQRHHTPELDRTLGATSSPCSMFYPNSKFPRRNSIKVLSKFNLENSWNFQWKSIVNLKKFLWRTLFTFSRASKPYFISNFLG
jgi:hypothetical protein